MAKVAQFQMIKMNSTEFLAFRQLSVENGAVQFVEDFGGDLEVATQKTEEKFLSYLPEGLATSGNYFYLLKDQNLKSYGYLWFGERDGVKENKIFIFDIFVEPEFRGHGHGKWILRWLEAETKIMQIKEISLHVLGYNHVARELYESMGFEITNIYMAKKLEFNIN